MWSYLGSIAEILVNIQTVLRHSTRQMDLGSQTLRASRRRRDLTHTTKQPVANPMNRQYCIPHLPREEGQLLLAVLEYLSDGIVPLLHAFYTLYFNPVECSQAKGKNEIEVSAAIASAMFVCITHTLTNGMFSPAHMYDHSAGYFFSFIRILELSS